MPVFTFGPTTVETAAACEMELAFLRAIADDHGDDLAKFAYADWLDERGRFLREFTRAAKDPAATLDDDETFELTWRLATGVRPRTLIRSYVRKGWFDGPYRDIVEARLMAAARPIIYMFATPTDEADLPAGCTKWGGEPDLPPGVPWPGLRDGGCDAFCAQVRLSDLRGTVAARELPAAGLLSFFTNPPGCDGAVLLHPEGDDFVRQDYPRDPQHEPYRRLLPAWFRFLEGIDLGLETIETVMADPSGSEFDDRYRNIFHNIYRHLHPFEVESARFAGHLLGWGHAIDSIDPPQGRRLAYFDVTPDGVQRWCEDQMPSWHVSPEDLRAGRLDRAVWCTG